MSRLPLLLAAAIVLLMALGARGGSPKAVNNGDTEKADYIYLEALRAKSQGRYDAAYSLLKRARELNPTDKETGLELSQLQLLLSTSGSDTAGQAMAIEMLREYWDANPEDYYTGVRYGLLAQRRLERDEALRVWNTLHNHYPDRVEISYQLADVLARGGDNNDRNRAIAIYDSIEANEGYNLTLSGNKIQLYYNENDTASMISEAQKLLESSPENVEFNVFAGKVYATLGMKDEALRYFDKACELDPSSGLAYYSKAEFYHSINDSVGFDREVFTALRQPDLDVDTKLGILRGYIQEMFNDSLQQPRIRQLFDTLIVQHPLEHDIHDMYARYLIATGDWRSAAEQEEQTLGLNAADPEGWQMLTSLYLQVENLDKAEDAIMRSLHYYPDNANMMLMLGAIYGQKKDGKKGMEWLEKALAAADSTDVSFISRVYTTMGDNMYQQELNDSSYAYYQKALTYDPANTLALNNAAYHMAVEGKDLDTALKYIETVMGLEQDNPTSLDTYAWVLFKRKDYAKAREVIDRTLELTPEDEAGAELLEHAGDIYFMDGEPDRAVEFWQRALKEDPENQLLKRKVQHKTYFFK